VLATLLSGQGSNIVVIDMDEKHLARLGPEFTGQTIVNDGTDITVLEEAKIQEADALVATTGDDNSNLMSAQIAKNIFQVERVLVRIKDPNKLDVYKEYDLEAVSATTLAAYKLSEMLKTSREIEILGSIGQDKAKIVKFKLPTQKTCDTLSRMISSGIFQPAAVFVGGKLDLGLPENKLSPGATVVGSVLTDDIKRLNRLFSKGKNQ
jgi:trk system potassium uptake protein TrkA